jgi:hypothetical protein
MTEEQTPAVIFKEYVKSLITEIVNESDISLNTDQSEALRNIQNETDEVVRLFGQLQDTIDDIDLDSLGGLDDRIRALETALSDINSATDYI